MAVTAANAAALAADADDDTKYAVVRGGLFAPGARVDADGSCGGSRATAGNGAAGPLSTPTAVRQMRSATARQQEGELVAVRKLLARAETKQQALLEQLAIERQRHAAAAAEAEALRALAADYGSMREQHAAALEMLGEKEEELDSFRAATG